MRCIQIVHDQSLLTAQARVFFGLQFNAHMYNGVQLDVDDLVEHVQGHKAGNLHRWDMVKGLDLGAHEPGSNSRRRRVTEGCNRDPLPCTSCSTEPKAKTAVRWRLPSDSNFSAYSYPIILISALSIVII